MTSTSDHQFELRDLRYFEAVAEIGHVGKAAKFLNLSQPALTKCVRRLEETFGTVLFERRGRRIQITPGGMLLLEQARILGRQTNDLIRVIDDFSKGTSGIVKIGTAPVSAELLLPEVCSLVLKQTRDVKIEVTIGMVSDLRSALKAGEFDVIVAKLGPADTNLNFYPLLEDEVVVIARKSHEVFGGPVRMVDLIDYGWALPTPDLELRQEFDAAFLTRNLPRPTAQIEVNSLSLLPPIIEQTDLLSIMWHHQLTKEQSAMRLQKITLEECTIRRRFGVQWRKKGYLSPAARLFLEVLKTQRHEIRST